MLRAHRPVAALILVTLTGCVLTPEGAKEERDRAERAGAHFEKKFQDRELPEIPAAPTWQHVLSRAFLADGELESAYFRWRAALERIDAAGTWPNSNIQVGFDTMFSAGEMKTFDRTTFSAGFEGMESLSFPTKTAQAAKVALDEARATGERFRAVKFDIQKRVLTAWADYVRLAKEIQINRETLALRRMLLEVGQIQAAGGAGQRGLVEADVMLRLAELDLDDMVAEHASMRAMLNAWMHRGADESLGVPQGSAGPREVPPDDAELVALAAEAFPEVSMFAQEVQGRRDALELARMRWIPDISPTVSFTGSVAQAVGAMIMLPTTVTEIRAGIREAEHEVRGAEAMLRQRKVERIGEYVGLLITLRRAQARGALLKDSIEPAAQRLAESQRRAYEGGSAELREVLESQELVLNVRVLSARTDAVIEKAIAEIECCLGTDLEMVKGASHE